MTDQWATFLWQTYQECRRMPRWSTLKSLHDEEDQEYFDMLDEQLKKEESL